ncbi:MAG: hypothetical protein HOQ05_10745 [Corynebacteriales bacterium]|nr:hypothetical protein [Mycobacteriales bacterium]
MASRLTPPNKSGIKEMPRERKILLALIAVAVLLAGYLIFQIAASEIDLGSDKKSSGQRERTESEQDDPTEDPAPPDVVDEAEQPDVAPDASALDVADKYVAAFYNLALHDSDPTKWRKEVLPYCDVAQCEKLLDYQPVETEPRQILGAAAVDISKPNYVVLAYPGENDATVMIYVGLVDVGWRVYSHDVEWR